MYKQKNITLYNRSTVFYLLKHKDIGTFTLVRFIRNVITKTSLEKINDGLKTAFLYTKMLVGGYPVKKFAHKIIQNPFVAREDIELKLVYGYYKLSPNNLLFLKPSDRILLNLILTRSYAEVVNELPHVFYHSKKSNSRLYTIPSDRYLNPKDYKAGDAIVYSTGQHLEFKTNNLLTEPKANAVVKQFKHMDVLANPLGLSVLYNEISRGFDKKSYIETVMGVGFRFEDIYLISQEKCSSMFRNLSSIDNTLSHYNVKWSVYVQEHNYYLEEHLNALLKCTQQASVREEAQALLDKIQISKQVPGSVSPNKIFKSLTNFKGYNSSGNHIQVGGVEEPEDIFTDVSDWFDVD